MLPKQAHRGPFQSIPAVAPMRRATPCCTRDTRTGYAKEQAMHIVTWKYDVMEGKNREDLLAVLKATAHRDAYAPGLVRRYSVFGPGLRSVMEFYVWSSKADADAYFDMDWDSETSRAWESARMTREDFEVVNVVQPHRAPIEA
jgi:hypothetical protein